MLRSLILPLGAFAIGLGMLVGGQAGKALIVVGTVLCGVAVVLVAVDA